MVEIPFSELQHRQHHLIRGSYPQTLSQQATSSESRTHVTNDVNSCLVCVNIVSVPAQVISRARVCACSKVVSQHNSLLEELDSLVSTEYVCASRWSVLLILVAAFALRTSTRRTCASTMHL